MHLRANRIEDQVFHLFKSPRLDKKYAILTPDGKRVDFGAKGYSDYTKHKDPERKKNYLLRHAIGEQWDLRGIDTAGFWSRWLLWNKETLAESIKYIEKVFRIKIVHHGYRR